MSKAHSVQIHRRQKKFGAPLSVRADNVTCLLSEITDIGQFLLRFNDGIQ